jgi:hypothetical protein
MFLSPEMEKRKLYMGAKSGPEKRPPFQTPNGEERAKTRYRSNHFGFRLERLGRLSGHCRTHISLKRDNRETTGAISCWTD